MKKNWIWIIGLTLLFLSFAQPFALTEQKVHADEKMYESVVLRGSADTLDWSSNDHPLQYDEEEGLWLSSPIELEGGEKTEYKFVYDGNWMPGSNLTFTPPQDGSYIFAFHPEDERTVDVRLANNGTGSLTLELTVPENTPEWIVPTVASNKNNFNYEVSPMKKIGDRTYEIAVTGESGETLSYFYSLSGEPYKEVREEPRTATFTADNKRYQDQVTEWETIPVVQDVTHEFNHEPYTPDKNDQVEINVTVNHYGPIDQGSIYYTTDGSSPDGKRGKVANGKTASLKVVETKANDNGSKTTTMTGTIPKQKNETRVKYKIDVWNSESEGSQFADNNALTSDEATEFAYYVEDYESPQWAKESIIYQVFVDRFRDGSEKNNASVDPSIPYDEQLKGWMGGDLQGVLEKIDYIDDLGVNTIWISPIYEGPYSHGYHPTDFMNIDPRFGSNQLMKELVDEAHERDIKVVYDLVPNHTSSKHPFFQDALEKGEESPYFDWYTFLNWPNEYETFYGVQELPELNNDNLETRNYMLNEVVPFWMEEIGVDGFRLDYAKGPSQSFWVDFRHKVKELDEDAFIFGEVWDNLDTITSYTGKLDGAIDFPTQSAIYDAFINDSSMNKLADSLTTINEAYHEEFVPATFLDSHDMPRFLYEANGNTQTLKMAASLQFALPGAPIIYYGDEVGLSQSGNHEKVSEWKDRYYREMMIWDESEQNLDLKGYYEKLIDMRKEHKALTHGDFNAIYSDDDVIVFERNLPQDHVLITINKGEKARNLDIFDLYHQKKPNRVQLTSLLNDEKVKSHKGSLGVSLQENTIQIFDVKGKLRQEAPSEEQKYSKVVLRGSAPLDWESDRHLLSFDEADHVWKSEPISLTAGETVEFKYVRDGEWLEGGNLSFTPETTGDYIFIFDPQAETEVTVVPVNSASQSAA
ncbi:alpha-amylase family glycosyl hydrolase [Halobacillus mangrovi]|uniref:Alpha-amylase n=1 Tax=Halobacillus mangrovi TaxID=402384 RepID=A0A1W5ZT68_9BACI|nr:alpha-amylase family glycosyl hydrolase [Halobacillus mangrovi]ARI76506.1 alpha-amylase [Halobacillus mangrovi]